MVGISRGGDPAMQTKKRHDAADQQRATIDALGNRTSTVYDPVGRRIATIDPLGLFSR
jgi:YD repeat-containing protein